MAGRGVAVATSPISAASNDGCAGAGECGAAAPSNDVSSEQLHLIARRMSRALLRHPQLSSFDTDTCAMYGALRDFFTRWSERQRRAASMCLAAEQVACLLQYGEAAIRRAALA
ncbi:hypothetical protein DQ04_09441040, partial [Trypanosoma grayi]|uniref:hypothetical protein n=1 Tax=Trypanosoma grayi TaxID=71804 RepID=UPI0004F47C81